MNASPSSAAVTPSLAEWVAPRDHLPRLTGSSGSPNSLFLPSPPFRFTRNIPVHRSRLVELQLQYPRHIGRIALVSPSRLRSARGVFKPLENVDCCTTRPLCFVTALTYLTDRLNNRKGGLVRWKLLSKIAEHFLRRSEILIRFEALEARFGRPLFETRERSQVQCHWRSCREISTSAATLADSIMKRRLRYPRFHYSASL